MIEQNQTQMDHVSLKLSHGRMDFMGRIFSESSWYDEATQSLTVQKLYVTDTNEQVYSIVSGAGKMRERRAYRISIHGDSCIVHNGNTETTLPFNMLMLAVRSICNLEEDATPTLEAVEEILRAANC